MAFLYTEKNKNSNFEWIMDIEENKQLGLILEDVKNNIEKDKNYKVEKSILEIVSNFSDESRNIFFHDIAMDYMKSGNSEYLECLKQVTDLSDSVYANAQHILGHNCLLNGELEKAYQHLNRVNDVDREIYLNALIDLALVEEKLGNNDYALELYKKVIKFSNKNDLKYVKA